VTIAPGERAPAFTLPDEKGQPVTLPTADAPVVLVFYRGDW
jgi:peroxiredoxin